MGPSDSWEQRELKVEKTGEEGVMTEGEEGEGKAEEEKVAAVAEGKEKAVWWWWCGWGVE